MSCQSKNHCLSLFHGLGLVMWLCLIHLKNWWLEWHHLTIQLEIPPKVTISTTQIMTSCYQHLPTHFTKSFDYLITVIKVFEVPFFSEFLPLNWSQSPQGVLEEIDLMCNKSTIDDFVRLDADHSGLIVFLAACYMTWCWGWREKHY